MLENRIKIGDFVKLTGSTLKTVLYYHKIGLLQDPERSLGGYRLYGPTELSRMQLIKHLKSLGMDLKRIKEILGDIHNHKTLREVLQSLRAELLSEKKSLEERIEKIEKLLSEDTVPLDEDSFASPSFQMIMDILGPDQIEKYARTCPELFVQQRKVYSILDYFQWGENYQETFRALAEYFKAHPQEYQISLDYGARLARLAQLSEDDPEVEALARESAEFIKSKSQLMEILGKQAGIKKPFTSLYNDMVANVISPAQVKHGQLLFSFILQGHKQMKEIFRAPRNIAAIIVGILAANWINKKMEKWLGEKNVADTLSQSVANNVTSEMGLALLDVADVVRQHPAVIEYFHHAGDETFFEELAKVDGGDAVSDSIWAYLEKYGMRCPGEIDITRPRWSEEPTALIPMILSNVNNFAPNARNVKFEQGRLEAEEKALDLLSRLEQLPGGKKNAKKAKKIISILRNFISYREYPKYALVQHYYIYKQALLKEAARLVQKGVIQEKEDIYYLSFEELREVVNTNRLDYSIITKRKEDYEVYEKLTPPRVMTSEGEVISGEYDTGAIPQGALPGIPVSSGIIEGRARIILKMEDADIADSDILVTTFTDPSWTPVFVSVKGLVTEVGGLMTHGAIIAREYGLPAVVGVENATKLIKDRQQIRVNGTEGYVEML